MRPMSVLFIGTILALGSLVPVAEATETLRIVKECSQYTGEAPSFCTVTESNLAAIPVGTRILYYGPVIANSFLTSSNAVLAVGPGDSALGYCIVYETATPPHGQCAFHAGSGTLAGFQAIVDVTVDDKELWHWDGAYQLGAAK